jgi:hypothetical protein
MNVNFDEDRPGTEPEILQSELSANIRFKPDAIAIHGSPTVTFEGDVTGCDSDDTLKR